MKKASNLGLNSKDPSAEMSILTVWLSQEESIYYAVYVNAAPVDMCTHTGDVMCIHGREQINLFIHPRRITTLFLSLNAHQSTSACTCGVEAGTKQQSFSKLIAYTLLSRPIQSPSSR